MNMFARFDENPAMTFQDIKETKRYGQTDGFAPSKAVVGVDRPMKAPSMHIQSPHLGKIV